MSLYVIAEIKEVEGNSYYTNTVGYRIFDNKTMKYIDASVDSVKLNMKAGTIINGLLYYPVYDSIELTYGDYVFLGGTHTTNVVGTDGSTPPWIKAVYWTVIGKGEHGVLAVSPKGTVKKFSYEYIINNEHAVKFANLYVGYSSDVKGQKIEFRGNIDNIDIGASLNEKAEKIRNKMALLGEYGFTVDFNNNLIVTDKDIQNVVIPSMCKTIPKRAFEGCNRLYRVVIGTNVTAIEAMAFGCCSSLKSITIPGSVKRIGRECFVRCTALQNVELGEGIKKISDGAFRECTALRYIKLPHTLDGNVDLDSIFIATEVNIVVEVPVIYKDRLVRIRNSRLKIKWCN